MFKDRIRWIDIKAVALISICYIPAFIYRLFNREIWLCSERKDEAKDNGYWMYKYIRDNHPEQKCYYVISKNSFDRKKIGKYETLINWGSLRHYFMFVATRIRLSSHVNSDTPNFRVTNFLEKYHLLFNKRVFLQHGVTKDKISFGYYSVSRADLFICAGIKEYEFCKKEFGYPEGSVVLTGFARYDGLKDTSKNKNIISIIPTWRSWLNNVDGSIFTESDYYKKYLSLLTNTMLVDFLHSNSLMLVFYLHSEMQKYAYLFDNLDNSIVIARSTEYDLQVLINDSKLLITDYSSVAFDFAYLRKPIVYYHFDYSKYRECQHREGYFSYDSDGFGSVVYDETSLFEKMLYYYYINFNPEKQFSNRINHFFKYFDRNNCCRLYNEIKKL